MKFHEKLQQLPEVRELFAALAKEDLPDVRGLPCHRLPAVPPPALRAWDEPLASYKFPMEMWLTRWMYRILGFIMILMGLGVLLGGVLQIVIGPPPNRQGEDPVVILVTLFVFGGAFTAGGVWFFWWRANASNRILWIFPEGVAVRTNVDLMVHPWFQINDLVCKDDGQSAYVTMRVFSETYTIGGRSEADVDLCRYVEKRASAEWLPRMLQQLSAGRSLSFGACYLLRKSLGVVHNRIPWMAVEQISASDSVIDVTFTNEKPLILLRDRMMFPSLFLTLCRALTIYWHQIGDMNEPTDERDDRDAPEKSNDPPDEPPTDTRIKR
jgi:hypothetical protein